MPSNYKRLGDYIHKVENRNRDLKVSKLVGLSMTKEFRISTSNIVGTDMSVYKVVNKWQFSCDFMSVIRVHKFPVVLKTDDKPVLVSPAYTVFEVNNQNELNPEYLMMWFRRSEFDRYADFKCDSAIRGGFDWDALCDCMLPIPSPEKQQEIVREYHTIQNRIVLNNQLISKLEETAQAIYKQWFVDFEFPDENGLPYKSNGGEMVWCEELEKEIPVGWEYNNFGNLIETINGYAFKSEDFNLKGVCPIIKIKNIKAPYVYIQSDTQYYNDKISTNLQKLTANKGDILISMTGSGANQLNSAVGQVGKYYYESKALINQRVCKLLPKKVFYNEFVFQFISSQEIQTELLNGSTGSANQANISPNQIKDLKTLIPDDNTLKVYSKITSSIDNFKSLEMTDKLEELKELLLAKMTKVETEIIQQL